MIMEQEKMTMQEVEKKIEIYKELFSVVRLLKGEEIEETQKQKNRWHKRRGYFLSVLQFLEKTTSV